MELNTGTVRPKEIPGLLKICMDLELSPILWGPPGIGKSEMVSQFAGDINGSLIDLRLTQIDSVDLRGQTIPDLEAGLTRWLRPEMLPDQKGPGVIFLDEINRAEPRLQASCFSLLCERRIGDWKVPEGWLICAAANGSDHSDQIFEMDPALADRLVHLNVVADLESWIAWAKTRGNISSEIIAFLQTKPDWFEGGTKRIAEGHIIGYSPRGWVKVDKVIKATKDQATRAALVSGIVGKEAAAEFFLVLEELESYTSVYDLLKADRKTRFKMFPRTLAGLYNLAYAVQGTIKDAESVNAAFELIVQLRDLLDDNPNHLPVQEIQTLAAEMLFEGAEKIDGAIQVLIGSPLYDEYMAKRPEAESVAFSQAA
jgi:hypothetical protein